jgi:hypothetical protein
LSRTNYSNLLYFFLHIGRVAVTAIVIHLWDGSVRAAPIFCPYTPTKNNHIGRVAVTAIVIHLWDGSVRAAPIFCPYTPTKNNHIGRVAVTAIVIHLWDGSVRAAPIFCPYTPTDKCTIQWNRGSHGEEDSDDCCDEHIHVCVNIYTDKKIFNFLNFT